VSGKKITVVRVSRRLKICILSFPLVSTKRGVVAHGLVGLVRNILYTSWQQDDLDEEESAHIECERYEIFGRAAEHVHRRKNIFHMIIYISL
jgi:hypothetical protein